jgi:hypothetical protein
MIFKPSSLHKLFFTYICPRFYGGAPATPSNTTTTSTVNQSPWQNPVYQALMLGTKDKPGPITSMLRSSAEQTAAYNDMLKGGYSPVPTQSQYSGYSAPIKAPTDFSSAPATPAYTLPVTALAPAAPTGPNAIVNDTQTSARGGLMSLKGYADGGDTAKDEGYKLTKATQPKAVQTAIDKALAKQKGGKALSAQETDLIRAYNTNEQMGGYGIITMVNGKPQLGPPAQGTMTQTDYTKLLTAFTQEGYTLPANVAKKFPSVKSVAEQTASENLKNTIGTANTSVIADTTPTYDDKGNIVGYKSTNQDFLNIQKAAQGLGTPAQIGAEADAARAGYGAASDSVKASIKGLMEKANYTPKEIDAALMKAPANVSAEDYVAAQAQTNQMAGPKSWIDQGTSEAYMSPYMQNVVDIQKREANRDYAKQLQELNKQATAAGAYGGSRQAIERSEAARNQATKLADIQAQGQQQAYTSGMGQFSAEQGLGLQAGQANLTAAQQTDLANQQATNQQRSQYVQQALDAAKTNYGGQLTAEQANQAAQNATNQFNVQSGLQANSQNITALSAAGQQGQGLAGIATQQNQANLANLGAQGQVTQAEQALSQSGMGALQGTANANLNFINQATGTAAGAVSGQNTVGGGSTATVQPPPTTPFTGSARGGLVRNGKVVKRGKK